MVHERGYCFPRQARLLSPSDYTTVFRKNRRHTDQYWIVLAHRCSNQPSRLGLAIAKKRARRAVDRNRLKRIAREAFRYQQIRLTGREIVIMNKDNAHRASSQILRQSLDTLLEQIR